MTEVPTKNTYMNLTYVCIATLSMCLPPTRQEVQRLVHPPPTANDKMFTI